MAACTISDKVLMEMIFYISLFECHRSMAEQMKAAHSTFAMHIAPLCIQQDSGSAEKMQKNEDVH